MLEIRNNTIIIDGRELQFDNEILDTVEFEEKVIIVFNIDEKEDGGYDNVFCFTNEKQLLWRIKPAPVEMAGTDRTRYMRISIVKNECAVGDFWGRRFFLDMQNGEPVSMEIVK